jgi:hypothetical protein
VLLDLSRRKVVFDEKDGDGLDWPRLKPALEGASTASIDVRSLSHRFESAQFFVSEIRRVLRSSTERPCVLVVLSAPVSFDSGENLEPVSLEALPACRVIYVRDHAEAENHPFGPPIDTFGRRSRMAGPRMPVSTMNDFFDQLAPTLKPLGPKVIDVETATEMAKAIGEIRKALLRTPEASRE